MSALTPERLAELEALLDDEYRTNGQVTDGLADVIEAVKAVTRLIDSYESGDRVAVDSVRAALYGP